MKDVMTKEPFTCKDCKFWLSGAKCKAFDVIPPEMYVDPENEHVRKLDGQNGNYTFEANREPNVRRDYTL